MLKKTLLTISIFPLLIFLTSFNFHNPAPTIKTIIIDAGHGGKDQGAAGLHSTEAQICLAIAMRLGKQIENELPGVKVLYTRTTDIFPGNKPTKNEGDRYRASFANQSGADLFISIHCNSAGKAPGGWYEKRVVGYDEKVTYSGKGKKKKKIVKKTPIYESYYVANASKGTETYIWTAKENAHKEQMVSFPEASSEEDSSITIPDDDPTIRALKLIYTKKYFAKSFQLADFVQQEFAKSGRINRGVKQRNEKGIWVLHATGMPSILIETGFISNTEEENFLTSEEGQVEIVGNITSAIKNYISFLQKQQTDKNNNNTTRVLGSNFSFVAHEQNGKK